MNNDPVLDAIDKAKWNDSDIHGLWLCDGDEACQAMRSVSNQIEAIRTVYLASKQTDGIDRAADKKRIAELEDTIGRYEAELLNINHVCISNFPDKCSGQKLSVAMEECIAELKEQVPKVVKPIRVSRGTVSTGFPFLAWTCPECGCRKQVGSAERDDTPIGDKFCSCGVKLNWENT